MVVTIGREKLGGNLIGRDGGGGEGRGEIKYWRDSASRSLSNRQAGPSWGGGGRKMRDSHASFTLLTRVLVCKKYVPSAGADLLKIGDGIGYDSQLS